MSKNTAGLPKALKPGKEPEEAATALRAYYGSRYSPGGATPKTGAWFDDFDPSGTRASTPNEITADDLLSLSLLSAPVRGDSALAILGPLKERISALLAQIPVDETLASHSDDVEEKYFPAWRLETLLRREEVPYFGLTRASKLIARKRPHLYPILDRAVRGVVGENGSYLNPIRAHFQDEGLIDRIHAARKKADLPESISDLRIFDVITWMQVTANGRNAQEDSDARADSDVPDAPSESD